MITPGVVFTPPELAGEVARELDERVPGGARRVLDPACGDGALLAAMLERRGCAASFARTGLFGIELDPELAERARARLRALAGLEPGTELDAHVVCADALPAETLWPAETDVLANPPWVSFSGRQAASASAPGARRGWPSLHGAFLERIARHVATERTLAQVILPAQMIELAGYGPVRRTVTSLARLAGPPRELGERCFDGVVGPAVVIALAPLAADESCRDRNPACGAGTASDAPWHALRPGEVELRTALDGFPRLARSVFADPGVHTGNTARALVFDAEGPGRSPLRVGRDLRAYRLGPPSRFLRTDLPRAPGRRFRIAPIERYRSFPVLVRQTADRPIAALHDAPTYFRNSLLAVRAVDDGLFGACLDPAFVVGVLNGPVATIWHRLAWRDARQKAFPQVKVAHLASQPFPILSRAERPVLHDELAARVRALATVATEGFEDERRAVEDLALDAFGLAADVRERVLAAFKAASQGRRRQASTSPRRHRAP